MSRGEFDPQQPVEDADRREYRREVQFRPLAARAPIEYNDAPWGPW